MSSKTLIIPIAIICSFLITCKIKQSDVEIVKVKKSIPILLINGEVNYFTDSTEIYRYKDMVLYKIPYLFVSNEQQQEGDTIFMRPISTEIRHKKFVFTKGEEFGLMYDFPVEKKSVRLNVDSISMGVTFKHFKLHDLGIDSLIEIQPLESNVIREVYKSLLPHNISEPDSMFLYYSKIPRKEDFEFDDSLLPTNKRNKIFKVELIFQAQQKQINGILKAIPRRILTMETKTLKKIDRDEILSLFKRFEMDVAANKM